MYNLFFINCEGVRASFKVSLLYYTFSPHSHSHPLVLHSAFLFPFHLLFCHFLSMSIYPFVYLSFVNKLFRTIQCGRMEKARILTSIPSTLYINIDLYSIYIYSSINILLTNYLDEFRTIQRGRTRTEGLPACRILASPYRLFFVLCSLFHYVLCLGFWIHAWTRVSIAIHPPPPPHTTHTPTPPTSSLTTS